MTAALDALARLDAGPGLPGGLALADRYDRQLQQTAVNPWAHPDTVVCLICGGGDGPECASCTAAWDQHIERGADL